MIFDRRHDSRRTVYPDMYVDVLPNGAAWLSNISEGGLGLRLFLPAVSGQAVRLGFDLPGTSQRIEANCQIAWIDECGRNAGLRFLDLPEAPQQKIREWLSMPTPSLRSRLVGVVVGTIVLCGLTFAFLHMLGLTEPSSEPGATPSANKQTASPSDIVSPLAQPRAASTTDSTLSAPSIPKGAVVLQVAALTQESNALTMAETLRKKNFPAFVLRPSTDRYYRVRVGPYPDTQSAHSAKRGLEKAGFQAIVKR